MALNGPGSGLALVTLGLENDVAAGAPAVLFALDADDNSIAAGGTIDFSAGEVELSEDVTGATVTAKIHNASTGAEIAPVATATGVDFAAGVARTLADIFGAAPTWTDDQGVGDYELRVTVTDDEITTETSRYGFAVIQVTPAAPAWGGALVPGDGQMTLPVNVAAGVAVYARHRRFLSSGAWSAESESFKCVGPGNIVITGLTSEQYSEFIIYAKAGGVLSEWSEPRYAAPTDGARADIDQIMDAVAAQINALALTCPDADGTERDIAAAVEIPPQFNDVDVPCVKVFPDTEEGEPLRGDRNEITHRVAIAFCQRSKTEAQAHKQFRIRQTLRDRFLGRRLVGLASALCIGESESGVLDLATLQEQFQWVSAITLEFVKVRARG